MGDVRTKLHKVQDTLTAQFREMSPEENGVEVDMERFDDLYNPVMVFLEDIETRLESQEFDVDVADDIQKIEWKLNHCQAFQSDMDAHTPDYDLVCEKAEELKLGLTESQHPTLDRKLKELNGKWAAVADLLTNRWGGLRDQLVMKLRDTEVVADFERWLNEKKRRLPELTEDESNDPSDILFELEELAVQTSEKRATLEQSNDEGAADLANQFGKFENEVNSAKARQLGEEPQNTLDNIAERIDKWEAQLAVVRDSEDMSPSETAKELSQIEVQCVYWIIASITYSHFQNVS
jgi:DNA repair exonuclease SbcCD ATPase subunit